MNIQLKTGKTISVSVYEYLFKLQDDEVEAWYESCVADDLGINIESPFSNRGFSAKVHEHNPDALPEIEEIPEEGIED